MNLLIRASFVATMVLALVACSSAPEAEEGSADEAATELQEEQPMASNVFGTYGAEIDTEGAITPEDLLAKMQHNDSMEVTLSATINECCKKKGCWMNVAAGEGEEMKVTFRDYGFFVPKDGVEGKTAIMSGTATWDTLSVDILRHYAEDGGATAEEMEAITEPEMSLVFVADGVVIENAEE